MNYRKLRERFFESTDSEEKVLLREECQKMILDGTDEWFLEEADRLSIL